MVRAHAQSGARLVCGHKRSRHKSKYYCVWKRESERGFCHTFYFKRFSQAIYNIIQLDIFGISFMEQTEEKKWKKNEGQK